MLIEVGTVEVTRSLEDLLTFRGQLVPTLNYNWFFVVVENGIAVFILKCATKVQVLNGFLTDGDLPL